MSFLVAEILAELRGLIQIKKKKKKVGGGGGGLNAVLGFDRKMMQDAFVYVYE